MTINTTKEQADILALLQESYANAQNQLIPYIKEIRRSDQARNGIKIHQIQSLFKSKVWKSVSTRNGHGHVIHKITGTRIGFVAHKIQIDPGSAVDIAEKLQECVNILGNEIFKYKLHNWKSVPVFGIAADNYRNWKYNH